MRNLGAGLVLGAFLAAGSASADALRYECDISERDPRVDWISARIVFVLAGQAASVLDEITLSTAQGPVQARLRARGGQWRIGWVVTARDSHQNTAQLSYRARLDPQAQTVSVRVTPVGYAQSWTGSGRCRTHRP